MVKHLFSTPEQIRGAVAALIVTLATVLYVIGPTAEGASLVEPQSVFTLYGLTLGYLFGEAHGRRIEKRRGSDNVKVQGG